MECRCALSLPTIAEAKDLKGRKKRGRLKKETFNRQCLLRSESWKRNEKKEVFITKGWVLRGVDQGFIMSYKAICDTCKGNGYIYVTNTKGTK